MVQPPVKDREIQSNDGAAPTLSPLAVTFVSDNNIPHVLTSVGRGLELVDEFERNSDGDCDNGTELEKLIEQ